MHDIDLFRPSSLDIHKKMVHIDLGNAGRLW